MAGDVKRTGRPRLGSVYWHPLDPKDPQAKRHRGNPRFGHWDLRITFPDGTRGSPRCMPPEMSEAKARDRALYLTQLAEKEGVAGSRPVRAPAPEAATGETLEAWKERRCELLLEQGRAGMVKDIRGHFRAWVPEALRSTPLVAVTRIQLEAWVEWIDEQVRAGKLAAKTAANVWGTLTKSFDEASRSKLRALRVRDDNPATGVRGPDEGVRRSKTYLYPSELLALVSCPRVPLRWRRLFAVGAYVYARTGELEALEWEDIDLDRRRIHIHRAIDRTSGGVKETKTNHPRRIPIEATLVPLLEAMKRDAKRARVVDMPPTGDIPDRLRHYLRWAGVTRAELFADDATRKQIGFYDASRATGITWMAIRGDDPLKIQQRCGHASFSTTQGYIREAENLEHDVGDVFPALPGSLLVSSEVSSEGPAYWGLLRESTWKEVASPAGFEPEKTAPPAEVSGTSSDPPPAGAAHTSATDAVMSAKDRPVTKVPDGTPEVADLLREVAELQGKGDVVGAMDAAARLQRLLAASAGSPGVRGATKLTALPGGRRAAGRRPR